MKCYTDCISPTLAEKLKEKGMPDIEIVWNPIRGKHYCFKTYAEVIDWFMSKECEICIKIAMYSPTKFDWAVTSHNHWGNFSGTTFSTWQEAANAAIDTALDYLN